jgi:hypothetical protein
MGPIVLLGGVLVTLYSLAALFAGGSVASASRGVAHTRRYGLISLVVGVAIAIVGLLMILG